VWKQRESLLGLPEVRTDFERWPTIRQAGELVYADNFNLRLCIPFLRRHLERDSKVCIQESPRHSCRSRYLWSFYAGSRPPTESLRKAIFGRSMPRREE
jgi:hypothetical protein